MRVIAGTCKSLPLKTVSGMDTRPTTDRIKETLFNMINARVFGSTFLDLFSGSGGIGIEALSRGAQKAYFVENDKKAIACIKENLAFTKLEDRASVLMADARTSIRMFPENTVFDCIFMDPPYNKGLEKEILSLLSDAKCIHQDTLIIVEASLQTEFDYLLELGYVVEKEKRYKTNKHLFLYRQ